MSANKSALDDGRWWLFLYQRRLLMYSRYIIRLFVHVITLTLWYLLQYCDIYSLVIMTFAIFSSLWCLLCFLMFCDTFVIQFPVIFMFCHFLWSFLKFSFNLFSHVDNHWFFNYFVIFIYQAETCPTHFLTVVIKIMFIVVMLICFFQQLWNLKWINVTNIQILETPRIVIPHWMLELLCFLNYDTLFCLYRHCNRFLTWNQILFEFIEKVWICSLFLSCYSKSMIVKCTILLWRPEFILLISCAHFYWCY